MTARCSGWSPFARTRRRPAGRWPAASTRPSPRRGRSSRPSIPPPSASSASRPSLRAAVSPFPAAQSVDLTIPATSTTATLAGTLLLPDRPGARGQRGQARQPERDRRRRCGRTTADIVVEVNDDGVGIDTSRRRRAVQAGHLGLAMVRRRVEDAGGVLDIETRPDGGTAHVSTSPLTSCGRLDEHLDEPEKREWPRAKRSEAIRWTYVLLRPARTPPNLHLVKEANTPKAVAAATRGGRRVMMGFRSLSCDNAVLLRRAPTGARSR